MKEAMNPAAVQERRLAMSLQTTPKSSAAATPSTPLRNGKPAHTLGPWHTAGDQGVQIRSAKDQIAKVWTMRGDEWKANARLIAAAPELLEALQLADAMLSGANMNASVVERKVRAAIAKATGSFGESEGGGV
jgi:hypothetical protein